MFETTEKASQVINGVLKKYKNPPSVRILLQAG